MTKKEIAKDFLSLCSDGESKKAFERYADNNIVHHNPYFKGDSNSLINAMAESAQTNSNKIFEVKNIIVNTDMVAVHSYIKQENNDADFAVVHILKFKNDKIVEFWDVVQEIPANIINENGMF